MIKTNTKKLTALAMLSALAFLLALLFHYLPIPAIVPAAPFLRFEPKDVVIAIAGFIYGPLAVVPMAFAVAILEMPFSGTWAHGVIMNVASTLAFAGTASIIYKRKRTISGAAIGLVVGTIAVVIVMLPLNYLITPFFMGVPRHVVVEILIVGIGMFNFIKYAIVAAITMQLYVPLRNALAKAKLLPEVEDSALQVKRIKLGSIVVSVVILVLSILGILHLNGFIFIGG